MANSSLMGAQQPSLQQSRHPVAVRQQVGSNIAIFTHYFMNVAEAIQSVISLPFISTNHTARCHSLPDSWFQTSSRSIRYSLKPNPANVVSIYLCCYYHKCLALGSTTTSPRLLATNVGLINLDRAREPISPGPDHSTPKLMQPRPGRFITAQSQNPLQSLRAGPIFLTGYPPNRSEPHRQRQPRPIKDGSRLYRNLILTSGALHQTAFCQPTFPTPTSRTNESLGPAQTKKILCTGRFRCKLTLEFCQSPRILFHTLAYYIWYLVESRGYPYFQYSNWSRENSKMVQNSFQRAKGNPGNRPHNMEARTAGSPSEKIYLIKSDIYEDTPIKTQETPVLISLASSMACWLSTTSIPSFSKALSMESSRISMLKVFLHKVFSV